VLSNLCPEQLPKYRKQVIGQEISWRGVTELCGAIFNDDRLSSIIGLAPVHLSFVQVRVTDFDSKAFRRISERTAYLYSVRVGLVTPVTLNYIYYFMVTVKEFLFFVPN